MSVFRHGDVCIEYEVHGSGFPLLLIPGGGLNSTMANLRRAPFDPIAEFQTHYRCVAADLRNAPDGLSTGPIETERPWDSFTDDHLRLMDHLGIDKFLVLGFCIGGPLIWNLLKRAPDRIVAAVLAQPVGSRPEKRDLFYDNNLASWAPQILSRRPELKQDNVEAFLKNMFLDKADFVLTVNRDFARNCQTPLLVLPDDIPAHPYDVAMESALLAPRAQVSLYPWKEPKARIPLAVRHIRMFLAAHCS